MNDMNNGNRGKDSKSNIAANLRFLRSKQRMSQEDVAGKIGVSRQAVAKWESGETLPDILNCEALSNLYGVSLSDLVQHNQDEEGIPIGPKNKHLFGTVTIGERGQIVLPKKARDTFGLKPGDTMLVLGNTEPGSAGIALISSESFLMATGYSMNINAIMKGKEEEK